LIGELLSELLPLTQQEPPLFVDDRRLRRAVRAGLLSIAAYAGHRVPDQPTSPGENQRVLPQPHSRLAEVQIFSPIARERRLFAEGMPHVNAVMRDCFHDLDDPAELRELGTAIYLDRPLGFAKAPGEPDQTLLTSHLLFSRSIADYRLRLIARHADLLLDAFAIERCRRQLGSLVVDGLPVKDAGAPARPGVVSLQDALRLADDWMIVRTTRTTLNEFVRQYDLRPLHERLGDAAPSEADWQLLVPGGSEHQPTLCLYDRHLILRLQMSADVSHGYGTRGGVEFPSAGLRVLRAWPRGANDPLELEGEGLFLIPRR
jgi:hypothetical protein